MSPNELSKIANAVINRLEARQRDEVDNLLIGGWCGLVVGLALGAALVAALMGMK